MQYGASFRVGRAQNLLHAIGLALLYRSGIASKF
ncbi:MAG: hypothetical protein JWR21_3458 [Herminiimonas sp.]|nr:hypothetical protein [Herminiimonas sp.]MDB5854087.1 hypothetical protein [Herminiimonas sp.]